MTTTKNPLLKSLLALAIILSMLMAVLLLDSCKKEETPQTDTALLSIVQVSPTMATYNFYFNQSKLNGGALAFGGATAYQQIKSGEYDAKLTVESNTDAIVNKKVSIEKNKFHSLFIIDRGDKIDYLKVTDELKNPATDKAIIRFANFSPNANALNLVIKDGNAIISDKAYKAVSDFIEVDGKVYSFEIRDKESGAIKAELKDTDIKKGKIYTIIAAGMLNPTGTEKTFTGIVINNK